MLEPCRHRGVSDQGQLLCAKIKGLDREVSQDICEACPVLSADCPHLRFALEKQGGADIIVRFGNGRSEVWKGEPAGVRLQRAACALVSLPISTVNACATCALHRAAGAGATTSDRPAGRTDTAEAHGLPLIAGGQP